jgi:beta-galactosidase/beta-glucuronidase
MPHVIRLRGPWRLEPVARTRRSADGTSQTIIGPLPAAGETTVPSDWGELLGADFRGRVRYTRRFNRPSGMAQVVRIDLVIECVDAFGQVLLNGQPLGQIPLGFLEFREEIASRLELFNRLEIEVELPECVETSLPMPRGLRAGLPGGLVGEVRLEITGR